MIIGVLKGGLGNQLFQYAAVRNLAKLKKTHYYFDLGELVSDRNRQLSIQHLLNVEIKSADVFLVNHKTVNDKVANFYLLNRFRNYLKPWYLKLYIKEREGQSLKFFNQFPGNCILDGYWQNQGFFKEIAADLRMELTSSINSKAENYVAVHFRGGDYLDHEKKDYHGNATESYYQNAFEHMKRKWPDAVFHLFSDTPHHFKYNFFKKYQTEWQPVQADVKDLKKMASYQNFIIANSSFSWWAAWLGASRTGLVICPSQWYKGKSLAQVNPALDEWTKLKPW